MKFLILGAGPAGLAFANVLKARGIDSFLVLECEKEAGGLCRSVTVDGSPLDIGGGHFLDVRRPSVTNFLFGFMPESEWDKYIRDSRIAIGENEIYYPIESNIWQLSIEEQVEYIKSIATAGCNVGSKMPTTFIDWIYWKLGSKIANDYMIPYNRKLYGEELDELGTYWLEKLPNISIDETLISCLLKKPMGNQPSHVQFFYPKKYGYGELWLRMADTIAGHIEYNKVVKSLDFKRKIVETRDGDKYQAEIIVTTIPWKEFDIIQGMPDDIKNDISKLKNNSIQIDYYPDNKETDAHWTYYPNPDLKYHRILFRHNFGSSPKGYWTETNSNRVDNSTSKSTFSYMNKYAYPLNTIDKPIVMRKLLEWSADNSVYGLGRWGEHQHYNADLTVQRSVELAKKIMKSGASD